ncbi:MAG: TIGR02530 family flagellar biosynthesis protein [Dehalococcoidia bacterium]
MTDAVGALGTGTAVEGAGTHPGAGAPVDAPAAGDGFAVQFSKHAARRIEQRGLDMDAQRLARLSHAVDQAESKGARDSLILLDELALVVSVQHRTVVTAMDEQSSKEHVFTNIDSVVIAP